MKILLLYILLLVVISVYIILTSAKKESFGFRSGDPRLFPGFLEESMFDSPSNRSMKYGRGSSNYHRTKRRAGF